jgi:hypothetical protein
VLDDPGYVGEEMFIIHCFGQPQRELHPNGSMSTIDAFNAVHGGYRVKVEWGIGGRKRKWRKFMKKFEASRGRFPELFRSCAILTNFLQRCSHDMSAYQERDDNQGWDARD